MEVEIFVNFSDWDACRDALFIKFSLGVETSYWMVPWFVPDNPQARRVREGYWERGRSGGGTMDLDAAYSVWEVACEIDVRRRLACVLQEMKKDPDQVSRALETEMRKRGWNP